MATKLLLWRTSTCSCRAGTDCDGLGTRTTDHGGVTFIDLRDRSGLVQVVCNPQVSAAAHETAKDVRTEYVLAVRGRLSLRPADTINPNLPTGAVELMADEVRILNTARTTPFPVEDETDPAENTRLRHRYLDLRRPKMFGNLYLRHRLAKIVRDYLDGQGFLEVETPFLTRSTPEGARDYLVPSRVNPGAFYALRNHRNCLSNCSWSLASISISRLFAVFVMKIYVPIVSQNSRKLTLKCPFVQPADIFRLTEGMIAKVCREVKGIEVPTPFPRMSYTEAMSRYGNDKPDIRFGLELREVTELFGATEIQVFKDVIAKGGIIRGIVVPNAPFSRKEIDDLLPLAVSFGAKGLAWFRVTEAGWQSPLAKNVSEEQKGKITATLA